ncbi:hypothetical protein A3H65_01010 [Candidatus Giovannonibacteria bacterium RIFCSPLOWO2_02_FULL_45_14]|uniref:Bacterial spore germination immunoglobulin-like domain-containing protein n=1 Tax=Candidatus Giovannonibacteria bacterium RIFCSPLOWO2_12_FULL_44_15 TaxID=1798364 RepID=A0A1F5Y053_9BACT|nr:MAG: hypothetical protein A3C75_01435 [Candidatus Giovannonibacteria bacterium RIFCSPHIGHO2_02_FULL_44_31]OGF76024.1 MAG: hypothetical protein A3E62_01845 [Candidatus Giovannonibacteria bacterium RIFCSPHIGHO2_12_FULL_44_29]OGF90920.1 MAG: hypothetical protein A3H65_01010 [Candidatus Giovannonibacteria bacterium RIFCSPLOWO2_02_FULL_45_14]OGF93440.1 MAG: hypothetical protein A3G54_04080 [Candidatus Giovannonibacteria bacterium RIFCSPLOWO2_12_FULL_44_15]
MKSAIIIILVLIILGGAGWYYWDTNTIAMPEAGPKANTFEECVKAGYSVTESYPRQCKTSDGKTFVENIGNALEKENLIRLASPRPNNIVTSPLLIEGEARGTWYFEASFPVSLYDANGKLLARTPAQAEGEWMTENFVPFKAGLKFNPPTTDTGFLILEKDNPSGLPEHADELKIPVRFR